MKKFYAGRIEGLGEILAKLEFFQTYGGQYRMYRILSVEKMYWTNGRMDLAEAIAGLHITGEKYDAGAFDTFAEAKKCMADILVDGLNDLMQAAATLATHLNEVHTIEE